MHIPKPANAGKKGAFTVKIEIADIKGSTSRFELRMNYICPLINPVVDLLNSYQIRYDKNPPVPYIYKISSTGEIRIKFNSTMLPEASLNKTEYGSHKRLLK